MTVLPTTAYVQLITPHTKFMFAPASLVYLASAVIFFAFLFFLVLFFKYDNVAKLDLSKELLVYSEINMRGIKTYGK